MRLAHIHGGIGLLQRANRIGLRAEQRDAGGGARGHVLTAKGERQIVDRLLEDRRLCLGVRSEQRDAGGGACIHALTAKDKGQVVDRLLESRRLGLGIGLAEVSQQQCNLVAAKAAD